MGHLAMIRVLDTLFGLLGLGVGALAFHHWSLPALNGVAEASLWLAVMGSMVLLILGGLGVACLVAAAWLGRGRGRVLQTALACALLLTFPIGTVFAVYALWVCWANPLVRAHLAPRDSAAPRPRRFALAKPVAALA